ncbi:cyclic nucleotide-binding domain-containing protein [Streptomyces sp. DSM 40473]|uniref:Cyclic nucleotide-binding domain-containing protein n=2 Tax=Streptomyces hesseae TaxID=3075519 RepID=A0ABU2SP17_9ACTN|nr:cyclic nucleotide-binding domain-containing protein [Streptomyces sp. DSM 40473]MDT0449535.1 cyclic nucleotide-binding domain-containing protein [Streptomyces sp. DSM 40473]
MKGTGLFEAIPEGSREPLMRLGHEASFPAGTRLFEEGQRADRFWVIRTGTVNLDIHVPGRQAAVVETLGAGGLVGWSWLCPPHQWHLGAQATSPVEAWEFDAAEVHALRERDHELDRALLTYVVEVIGGRLRAARTRLLDLYGPYGSGSAR